VNACSGAKPKENPLRKAKLHVANFREGFRHFFPVAFLGIGFVIAWMVRAFAAESASSFANLFLLFVAAFATLFALNRRLPLQNVIALAAVIAFFFAATMLAAGALTFPIAPPVENEQFRHLPAWAAPLLWIIALINARGTAKLFLYTLRKKSNYGVALGVLSSLLVASLNLRAESSWPIFAVQFSLAIIALVATTPWFIDKKPVARTPDAQPLLFTILLLFW
jgi:hypothetical protein